MHTLDALVHRKYFLFLKRSYKTPFLRVLVEAVDRKANLLENCGSPGIRGSVVLSGRLGLQERKE